MDYLNSTGPSSTSSIYGTLPRTKKREKSKREKRTPETSISAATLENSAQILRNSGKTL